MPESAVHSRRVQIRGLSQKAAVAVAVAALTAAGVVESVWVERPVELTDVQRLARSLQIIRTSTAANRKTLKVLFYGQSITGSGWHEYVVDHWHQKYPNTVFAVQNRALGGFASQWLVRTTEQDIAAFYPDLIIFHVYGDHRAYEQIIRLFRSRTAADIIVQTDHGEVLPQEHCPEGLHFTLIAPPGCAGFLWYKQNLWNDEMSYHKIPAFARRYQLALEPQRDWWRWYLLNTGTDPQELLRDGLHPNSRGKQLMAMFFNQYFDRLVVEYRDETANDVHTGRLAADEVRSGEAAIAFSGARLELVSFRPIPNWPHITLDGSLPKDVDGCYHISRATSIGTVPDWPGVRRISLKRDHVPEQWTAVLSKFSGDQKNFDFTVQGTQSGPDGSGKGARNFVSKSGRLQIASEDWMVAPAWLESHTALQEPFAIRWSVDDVCDGQPEIIARGGGEYEYRYIVGDGLMNTRHVANVKGSAIDLAVIDHWNAYQPRLKLN